MRPLLFEIVMDLPHALLIAALSVFAGAIMLRRAGAMSWEEALRRGVESLATFGSRGSTEKTDISVPGSLGTVALALGAYGLVKEPVHLPVFGYAAMAFCGFTATAIAGWRTGPKLGVPPWTAIRVAFLCAFFGILGSRLFYVIEFRDQFSDQPATIAFGRIAPAKGQTLEVRTAKGAASVTFQGDEKTPSDVVARLAPLAGVGVHAKPIAIDRHIGDALEHIERRFEVATDEKGPDAKL